MQTASHFSESVTWRQADEDPPAPGMFVEVARAASRDVDRFGLNESKKTPIDRVYWCAANYKVDGLFWRPVPAPNFLGGASSVGPSEPLPIDEDFWYVVLCEPQQEVSTVWRLHEMGKELYIPIIRRRVKTGRTGRNGQKVTRILPRPMFPGYGLMRRTGITNINDLLAVRGVREVLRDQGTPIVLPHEAVLAIFRKQSQKHQDFVQENVSWRRRPKFKPGASVRVAAEGNVYEGLLASIEKDDGKGRIEILLGMAKIRHTLPADMVVAA